MKYQNQLSIVAIRRVNDRSSFFFSHVTVDDVFKEIRKLNSRKDAQATSYKLQATNIPIICDSIRKGKLPPI